MPGSPGRAAPTRRPRSPAARGSPRGGPAPSHLSHRCAGDGAAARPGAAARSTTARRPPRSLRHRPGTATCRARSGARARGRRRGRSTASSRRERRPAAGRRGGAPGTPPQPPRRPRRRAPTGRWRAPGRPTRRRTGAGGHPPAPSGSRGPTPAGTPWATTPAPDVPSEVPQHRRVAPGAGADVDRTAGVDAAQQPSDQRPPPGVPPVALLEGG